MFKLENGFTVIFIMIMHVCINLLILLLNKLRHKEATLLIQLYIVSSKTKIYFSGVLSPLLCSLDHFAFLLCVRIVLH